MAKSEDYLPKPSLTNGYWAMLSNPLLLRLGIGRQDLTVANENLTLKQIFYAS